ncbi:unnamed protein product [Rhizopus stolonifer]
MALGYVPSESNEDSQSIPMLLPSFVPLEKHIHTYANDLASFGINKVDPNWLKRIKLSEFGIQTKTTLTFGVVNHELLEVFRMYQPKKWDGPYWKETYNTVLEFAVHGPSWDIFPLTSSNKKLVDFEIIKKALLGLIFQIYTDEQIETIKSIGLIPYTLTKQEALLQSRFISATEFDSFKDFMFKDDEHQRPSDGLPHGVLDFKLKVYCHFEGRTSTSTGSLYLNTLLLLDTR